MKVDILTFSIIGLIIDFTVSLYFTFKLYQAHKKSKKNNFIKLFFYYFLLFSIFLLFTFVYQPRVITDNNLILESFFALGIGSLFIISAIVLGIFLEIYPKLKKYERLFFSFWFFSGLLMWLKLLSVIDFYSTSYFDSSSSLLRIVFSIIGIFISLPFIATATTFFYKSFKEIGKERVKYFFFGLSFLFVIVGGPLHSQPASGGYFFLADILTTSGFIFAFFALFLKE